MQTTSVGVTRPPVGTLLLPAKTSLTLGTASSSSCEKMQPNRIVFEIDINDLLLTTILLLIVLFSLAWIIYLQELLDELFLGFF